MKYWSLPGFLDFSPGQSHDGTNYYKNGQDEQVQVVATALLQLVLLPIYNHSRNLLIHEDQNSTEECGKDGDQCSPRGISLERIDHPATGVQCGFQLVRHLQFRRVNAQEKVHQGHGENRDNDREVADHLADLREREREKCK